jgi:hypothetical protein
LADTDLVDSVICIEVLLATISSSVLCSNQYSNPTQEPRRFSEV